MVQILALLVLLDSVYIVCVTKAAIYFNNPKILFWYLLILFIGYSVKSGDGKK